MKAGTAITANPAVPRQGPTGPPMVVRLLLRFTLPHFVDVHAGAYLQNVNVCVYARIRRTSGIQQRCAAICAAFSFAIAFNCTHRVGGFIHPVFVQVAFVLYS